MKMKRITLPWADGLRRAIQSMKLKISAKIFRTVIKEFVPLLNQAQADEDKINGHYVEVQEACQECCFCGTKLDTGSKRESEGKFYCVDCLEHETGVK